MLNGRLFKFWNDLPEALRTGKPQNETKHGEKGMFEQLYADPARLGFGGSAVIVGPAITRYSIRGEPDRTDATIAARAPVRSGG